VLYSLWNFLGFFFSSMNPVIPKNLKPWPSAGYHSLATPAFSTRGLQPFHGTALCVCFSLSGTTCVSPPMPFRLPRGPRWWGLDEQKRVLEAVAQSEKM